MVWFVYSDLFIINANVQHLQRILFNVQAVVWTEYRHRWTWNIRCVLTSSMRTVSSWETEVTAWLMTLRSPALAMRRSLWQERTDRQVCWWYKLYLNPFNCALVNNVLMFAGFLSPLILTVTNLVKSSWERKRRSASCRVSAGMLQSWVWRSFMEASPPSTVRNCPNMVALHTKSFSCNWAPATETWTGQNWCPTVLKSWAMRQIIPNTCS